MRLVIADTGPINYPILIEQVAILPRLFERVILPDVVHTELSNASAPRQVREWVADLPPWVEIAQAPDTLNTARIHSGEAAAISLASSMQAGLLLMDDRRGVRAAKAQGLRVTGTLGVLDLAAERGLVDFHRAVAALGSTSFRRPERVLQVLLAKHRH